MMSNEVTDSFFEEREAKTPSIFSASLLITGTCIGAGMLAIPFVSFQAGFLPSFLMGFLSWLFMLSTGLLFLEATLWLPDGANVLSISEKFLGKGGKTVAGFLFLFLYYCLLVSYMDEGSALFFSPFIKLFGPIGTGMQISLFSAIFGMLVIFGTRLVSKVNHLFLLAMAISYGMLVVAEAADVHAELLLRSTWRLTLFSAPTLFSAYGYHNIIPTLSTYMKRDPRKLKLAILLGTTIPFIAYSLWMMMIVGSFPSQTLQTLMEQKVRTYEIVAQMTSIPLLSKAVVLFAFFAITTSFLGVSLSMVDFLADGLKVERSGWSRLLLSTLVFVPPGIFAYWYPGIFIEALGVAGGIGEALINGMLPIAVIWIGRYHKNYKAIIPLPGGKGTLAALALFTLFIMGLEIYHLAIYHISLLLSGHAIT